VKKELVVLSLRLPRPLRGLAMTEGCEKWEEGEKCERFMSYECRLTIDK